MKHTIVNVFLFFTIIQFASVSKSFAQNNTAAFAAADTTRFSVDLSGGWQIFNSYVNQHHTDSAVIELIVQHSNNMNWYQPQYVGKIKYNPLKPGTDQYILFNMLNGTFRLLIKKSGKCYITFVSGSMPTNNPAIIPLQVYYKL
jgi:hypothetical protein